MVKTLSWRHEQAWQYFPDFSHEELRAELAAQKLVDAQDPENAQRIYQVGMEAVACEVIRPGYFLNLDKKD